jgi:hypothetical protein
MLSDDAINKLLSDVENHIGTLFNDANADEYHNHLANLVSGDELALIQHLDGLFTLWSNIREHCGESIETSSNNLIALTRLRDYRFAMAIELNGPTFAQ